MKIALLNDYSSSFNAGGAEVTSYYLRNRLIEQGHDVIESNTQSVIDADLYIVSNIRTANPRTLQEVLNRKFIYFPRDILPVSEKYIWFVKELYKKAIHVVFLSPLHAKKFMKKYGLSGKRYFLYIPFFEDIYYQDDNRHNHPCWVGSYYFHKGVNNCLLWARDNNTVIDFYGKKGNPQIMVQAKHSKYGILKEAGGNNNGNDVHTTSINNVLSKYKNFIHLPDCIEAFGRTITEAMLSGCNVHVNENDIGFYSWNFRDRKDFFKLMNHSQNKFMELINE